MTMNGSVESFEEDSSRLIFPQGFEDAKPIFNDEVLKILTERKSQSNELSLIENHAYFEKSFQYVSNFQRFPCEIVGYVRSLFDHDIEGRLHPFEISLIANLCPQSSKEAMALIPSLKEKYHESEEELESILDKLQQYLKTHF